MVHHLEPGIIISDWNLQLGDRPRLEALKLGVFDTDCSYLPKGMTFDPYSSEQCRWSAIQRIVCGADLFKVDPQQLTPYEVDWAISRVYANAKPLAPKSVI